MTAGNINSWAVLANDFQSNGDLLWQASLQYGKTISQDSYSVLYHRLELPNHGIECLVQNCLVPVWCHAIIWANSSLMSVKQISVKFESKHTSLHLRKLGWQGCLQNGDHFVSALIYLCKQNKRKHNKTMGIIYGFNRICISMNISHMFLFFLCLFSNNGEHIFMALCETAVTPVY